MKRIFSLSIAFALLAIAPAQLFSQAEQPDSFGAVPAKKHVPVYPMGAFGRNIIADGNVMWLQQQMLVWTRQDKAANRPATDYAACLFGEAKDTARWIHSMVVLGSEQVNVSDVAAVFSFCKTAQIPTGTVSVQDSEGATHTTSVDSILDPSRLSRIGVAITHTRVDVANDANQNKKMGEQLAPELLLYRVPSPIERIAMVSWPDMTLCVISPSTKKYEDQLATGQQKFFAYNASIYCEVGGVGGKADNFKPPTPKVKQQ